MFARGQRTPMPSHITHATTRRERRLILGGWTPQAILFMKGDTEVIRLTRLEMGDTKFDFVGYFRFLEKNGYVEFAK